MQLFTDSCLLHSSRAVLHFSGAIKVTGALNITRRQAGLAVGQAASDDCFTGAGCQSLQLDVPCGVLVPPSLLS